MISVVEQSWRQQARVACVAFAVLLGTGCGDKGKPEPAPPGLSSGFADIDTTNLSEEQRALVKEAINDYDVDPADRPPVPHDDHDFPGATTDSDVAPRMTIATMRLKSGHPKPPHRLIARIKSDSDYTALGIRKGMNLVWRSSWDSATAKTWVTKIVPVSSPGPDYALHRDARLTRYTEGPGAEPRLVKIRKASFAIATCLDDPMCGSGHCGYW